MRMREERKRENKIKKISCRALSADILFSQVRIPSVGCICTVLTTADLNIVSIKISSLRIFRLSFLKIKAFNYIMTRERMIIFKINYSTY